VLSDLSEEELRKKFMAPYKSGKNFLFGSEIVEASCINAVSIFETDRNSAVELKLIQDKSWKEMQDFNNADDSIFLLSLGRGYEMEDIVEAGRDVTAIYVSGPPGHQDSWSFASRVLNHPWISTIGAGLILGGLLFWLKWN
jgi:hypothetical protein